MRIATVRRAPKRLPFGMSVVSHQNAYDRSGQRLLALAIARTSALLQGDSRRAASLEQEMLALVGGQDQCA